MEEITTEDYKELLKFIYHLNQSRKISAIRHAIELADCKPKGGEGNRVILNKFRKSRDLEI